MNAALEKRTFGVSVGDVSFSNKPDGQAKDMAAVGNAQISVALMPLFRGDIQIARIVLDKPVINLEVGKDGQTNWTFSTTPSAGSTSTSLPQGVHFSGIQIKQGLAHWDLRQSGCWPSAF